MSTTVDEAAAVVDSPSKNVVTRRKAADAAHRAALAAMEADRILQRTRKSIADAALQDLRAPTMPASPSAVSAEATKCMSANNGVRGPWVTEKLEQHPTLNGIPQSAHDEDLQTLLQLGLKSVSHRRRPLDMKQATVLCQLLADPNVGMRSLDLSGSFDPNYAPEIPQDLLDRTVAELREEIGTDTSKKQGGEDEEEEEQGDDEAAGEDGEDEGEKENPALVELQARLEKLKMEFTTFDEGLVALARNRLDRQTTTFNAISSNKTLHQLDLSKNEFGAPVEGKASYQPLRRLAKLIDANRHLKVLDLGGNNFGPVGIGLVAKALCRNISIHTVDLSGNDVVAPEQPDEEEDPEQEEDDPVFGELQQGLEALSELLKKNKFITSISLRNNLIKGEVDAENPDDDGAETQLGKFLEPLRKYHNLQVLDLASNELGAGGAKLLQLVLSGNYSVRVLDLSDNQLGPQGLGFISKLICANDKIESLILQKNELAGKQKGKKSIREAHVALTAFSNAMGKSTALTELNLSGNHFGHEFSASVLEFLPVNLQKLHFSANHMCGQNVGEMYDAALSHLVKHLTAETSQISLLNVAGNFVQAQGMAMLTAENQTLQGVSELNLGFNALGDEGLQILGAAIANANQQPQLITSLRDINLSHNGITSLRPLVRALQIAPSIEVINLDSNNVSFDLDAYRDFLDVVSNKPMVKSLSICSNQLNNPKPLVSLCRTATPPFEHLDILDNPLIDLNQSATIVRALQYNRAIKKFRMSSQQGEYQNLVEEQRKVLETNTTLTDIDLTFPLDVEPEQVAGLTNAMLRNALAAANKK